MSDDIQKENLFSEVSALIEQARSMVVAQANYALTLLFWKIGRRVNEEVLQNKRADYGKQIVVTLSRQLTESYGRNFEERNLRRMLQYTFAGSARMASKTAGIDRQSNHQEADHRLKAVKLCVYAFAGYC